MSITQTGSRSQHPTSLAAVSLLAAALLAGCGIGLCAPELVCGTASSSYPPLTLSNYPTGISRMGFLNVAASGTGMVGYTYKVTAGATDCTYPNGYADERPISETIDDVIAALPDGPITLCALGKDSAGLWQSASAPTSVAWIKDMTPVVENRYAGASNWMEYATVDFRKKHGGESRIVRSGMNRCNGLTAEDSLDVFYWECIHDGTEAVFYSRLREDRCLLELIIPGSPNGSWRPITITIQGIPGGDRTSASTTWWNNVIEPLPDSSAAQVTLDASQSGKIFTQTTSTGSRGININGDRIGIAVFSGATLTSTIPAANCDTLGETGAALNCLLASGSQSGIWIEGGVWNGATLFEYPIVLYGISGFSLRRLRARVGMDALNITNASDGDLTYLQLDNANRYGLEFANSSYNRLIEIRAANTALLGPVAAIELTGGNSIEIDQLHANNSAGDGVLLFNTTKIAMTRSTGTSNAGYALQIRGGNRFRGAQLFGLNSAAAGIRLRFQSQAVVLNAGGINNSRGLDCNGPVSEALLYNVTAAQNGTYGIDYPAGCDAQFQGNLLLGSNSTGNCNIGGVTNLSSGGFNASCSPVGVSNEVVNLNIPSTTFVGKAGSDLVNSSGGGTGVAAYAVGLDWFGFQRPFRSWGISNAASFPNAAFRGRCSAGNCQIFDYANTTADALFLNRAGTGISPNSTFTSIGTCPVEVAGNQTGANSWDTDVFLLNAVEFLSGPYRTEAGDHDGLCEADESCLYTPNIGPYQGHGNLVACEFQSAGGLTGISMYGYELNSGY